MKRDSNRSSAAFKAGEAFGVVESVNNAAVLKPDLLMKDCYEEGWLIRLKPDSPASFENLLSAADYEEQLRKRRSK